MIPRLELSGSTYIVTGNCSDLSDLPDISFVIDGDSYNLPPSAWVLGVSDHCTMQLAAMCSYTASLLHYIGLGSETRLHAYKLLDLSSIRDHALPP